MNLPILLNIMSNRVVKNPTIKRLLLRRKKKPLLRWN